jgi:hypothetical protein
MVVGFDGALLYDSEGEDAMHGEFAWSVNFTLEEVTDRRRDDSAESAFGACTIWGIRSLPTYPKHLSPRNSNATL